MWFANYATLEPTREYDLGKHMGPFRCNQHVLWRGILKEDSAKVEYFHVTIANVDAARSQNSGDTEYIVTIC